VIEVDEGYRAAVAAPVGERIATAGGSFGGWTSIAVNSYDRRPKAVFALVPAWGKGPLRTELLTAAARLDDWERSVPVFLLAGEGDKVLGAEEHWMVGRVMPRQFLDGIGEYLDLEAPERKDDLITAVRARAEEMADADHDLVVDEPSKGALAISARGLRAAASLVRRG
jgi:dienelactone hydrolase